MCPRAYCATHTDNNIFSDSNGALYCSEHAPCMVKGTTSRRPSYVNRNSPILEYEQPFTEKYRPPPLKDRINSSEKENENEILMEPNLTKSTPIIVENPLLSAQDTALSSSTSSQSSDPSIKVVYVDQDGMIVDMETPEQTKKGIYEVFV